MIAFTVRIAATVLVLGSIASFAFISGWVITDPRRPGFGRHKLVDWACPSCDVWSTAYVSKYWRRRALRRALGLSHRRLSPACPGPDADLMIVEDATGRSGEH